MKILLILTTLITILDSKTNEPIVGVEVLDLQTNVSYYTDINGNVNVDDSSKNIYLKYITYKNTTVCIDTNVCQKNIGCVIRLEEE